MAASCIGLIRSLVDGDYVTSTRMPSHSMKELPDLVDIVERASTPLERLGPGFVAAGRAEVDAIVEARLERWRLLVADGNDAVFARRLALDGLDENTARRALGPVRLAPGQPLPAWTDT